MNMQNLLKELADIATEALKKEDAFLKNGAKDNPNYKNDKRGILLLNYERYFQYLIARSIIASSKYKIQLEQNYHDIVLSEQNHKSLAVIELKRWMSETGNPELPKITIDINKLKESKLAGKKILMIFSVNPRNDTELNRRILFQNLKLDISQSAVSKFLTYNATTEVEFWISCVEIK